MLDTLEAFSSISVELLRRLPGAQVGPLIGSMIQDMRRTIPFDAAWWGWGRIKTDRSLIQSSSVFELPGQFRSDLKQLISTGDPLARSLECNPRMPALYDRLADRPDSAFAAFTSRYDIRHAMRGIGRSNPNMPHLFLSLYRKGDGAAPWATEEIELFSKFVPLLDAAIQHCDMSCNKDKVYDTIYMDVEPGGTVLTRSPRSVGTLRSFFPDWKDGRVIPKQYLDHFTEIGSHRLQDLGLVIEVAPASLGDRRIDICCVEIRREGPCDLLSPQEMEVGKLLALGKSIRVIAEMRGKSPNTVQNQVQSIYLKLGVSTRAELGTLFRDVT